MWQIYFKNEIGEKLLYSTTKFQNRLLYEKVKIQQSTLSKGESHYNKRSDEMKQIIKDVERRVKVLISKVCRRILQFISFVSFLDAPFSSRVSLSIVLTIVQNYHTAPRRRRRQRQRKWRRQAEKECSLRRCRFEKRINESRTRILGRETQSQGIERGIGESDECS